MPHPFDPSTAFRAFSRYAEFTDLAALNASSAKPLRKSIRVNTLKCTVEEMKAWAKSMKWTLEPVPWCPEGFYIDRPSERDPSTHSVGSGRFSEKREALGKDLMHLFGCFYMQEAASMLPVALLDPKPGEMILDMSAAPGSKTTQIAARMGAPSPSPSPLRGEGNAALYESTKPLSTGHGGKGLGIGGMGEAGRGVLIANDVQEKRIWSLITNLQRSGVTNAVVTRKVGQWFAGNMTERFDRVLCDAPCTAQGTVRKDSDSLTYCSLDNIGKMAKLQRELLESAAHACKVGGRIVYSTCTLTPEENEDVVRSVLQKFSTQLVVLDPVQALSCERRVMSMNEYFAPAIADSEKVQLSLKAQSSKLTAPCLRLWPQTYDTEGFFCAVLQKIAPTRDRGSRPTEPHRWQVLPKARTKEISDNLIDWYGTSFIREDEVLTEYKEQLSVMPSRILDTYLPLEAYLGGLPFGKATNHGLVRLSHEIAALRGLEATKQVLLITEEEFRRMMKGQNLAANPPASMDDGDVLLAIELPALGRKMIVGRGVLKAGIVMNRLPREMVRMFS